MNTHIRQFSPSKSYKLYKILVLQIIFSVSFVETVKVKVARTTPFQQLRTVKTFETDETVKTFKTDEKVKIAKKFETDETVKTFKTDETVKKFETDETVKTFKTDETVKKFETDETVKTFKTDETVKKFETDKTVKTVNITKPEIKPKILEYLTQEEMLIMEKTCQIPKINPFAPEIMAFDVASPELWCPGEDVVKCYLSKCSVNKEIVDDPTDLICTYRDILYKGDRNRGYGPATRVNGFEGYTLRNSDFVEITCRISDNINKKYDFWYGHGWGVRTNVGDEADLTDLTSINVLMIGYDSLSHSAFIRKMPKSYNYVQNVLGATILNGYNVIGDGTPAALIPLLTGKAQSELPHRKKKNKGHVNHRAFIFDRLKPFGYRTAYFEDMPWVGTFTLNYPGFKTQPAHHYARSFYEAVAAHKHNGGDKKYCVGDTPNYKLMMNASEQILSMPGKKFVFTIISDVSHDDINVVGVSDNEFVEFLNGLKRKRYFDNTLLVIFGDHGPRYGNVRSTNTGRFEERLPLMALLLPKLLKKRLPFAQKALETNADVLTTPLDIHNTVLDAMGLRLLWNRYKVSGVNQLRGLTLLERIPVNRSCYEAEVDMHWCSCLKWTEISAGDPKFNRAAEVIVNAINWHTEFLRSKCAIRKLKRIIWVKRAPNHGFNVSPNNMMYQVKLAVSPGHGVYEATLNYNSVDDDFNVHIHQISRTNRYNDEPKCIVDEHPQMSRFCFCINIH